MPVTSNMTFETIVEKTKRMLGKNYHGDTEMVPVYSLPAPIEGHSDASLIISNGNFTNDEITLIKEKTKNYAWWVANKGYLIDDSRKEIPALFVYGSEIGGVIPDVLNFNGLTENNFFCPIDRTDMNGDVNNSSNHVYVQYDLDGELQEFETDRNGNNSGIITINDISYKFYAGRLYPEDRILVENNLCYPIYLVSNLDYYCISETETKNLDGAHDMNLVVQNNLEILQDVCDLVTNEAAQCTNRIIDTKFLNECWPIIVKCSCMAYLNRGAEGLTSQSELGQQNTYNDWVSVMHQQLTNRRYVI